MLHDNLFCDIARTYIVINPAVSGRLSHTLEVGLDGVFDVLLLNKYNMKINMGIFN